MLLAEDYEDAEKERKRERNIPVTSEEVSMQACSCRSPVQHDVCPMGQSNRCCCSRVAFLRLRVPLGAGAGVSSTVSTRKAYDRPAAFGAVPTWNDNAPENVSYQL